MCPSTFNHGDAYFRCPTGVHNHECKQTGKKSSRTAIAWRKDLCRKRRQEPGSGCELYNERGMVSRRRGAERVSILAHKAFRRVQKGGRIFNHTRRHQGPATVPAGSESRSKKQPPDKKRPGVTRADHAAEENEKLSSCL